MFYLTTHSTHFIYGYMASDIWLRTILIVREETRCHHYMDYSFRLAAELLLSAPSTDRITHTTAFVTVGVGITIFVNGPHGILMFHPKTVHCSSTGINKFLDV